MQPQILTQDLITETKDSTEDKTNWLQQERENSREKKPNDVQQFFNQFGTDLSIYERKGMN